MGTRSLTAFINKGRKSVEICNLYRQYDGFTTSHGLQLARFINDAKYNGISCLAAQVVAHFKKEIGNFYLEAPGERDMGEEYIYEVYCNDNGDVIISCYDVTKEKTIFSGTPKQFIKKYDIKEHV